MTITVEFKTILGATPKQSECRSVFNVALNCWHFSPRIVFEFHCKHLVFKTEIATLWTGNKLGNEGITALSEALERNTSLIVLDVSSMKFKTIDIDE